MKSILSIFILAISTTHVLGSGGNHTHGGGSPPPAPPPASCAANQWNNGGTCTDHTVRSACTGKTTVGGPTARLVAGTATADSSCTSCVAGTTFGPADGSTDCAPVTVRSACTGKTTAGGPTARLVAGTATADSTCTSCVAGTTFGPADGSTDCAPVTVRSACTGKTTAGGPTARLVAGTATADSTCTSCVAGTTFGPADGSTDCAPVTVRSACTGKTTAGGPTARLVAGTATADSTCTSCVAGTTFGPADGSTDCAPVTVRSACTGKTTAGGPTARLVAGTATADSSCTSCVAGTTFGPADGSTDCAPVTVRSACTGKTTAGGPTARLVAGTATADSTCTSCVAGTTFGPADGSTDCAPVTVRSACTGKTTAGGPTARLVAGTATADSTCTSCVAGTTFGPADGSTDCAPVTVRSACTGKTTAGGPTARLVAGTATADSTCTSCVAGTTFGPADGSTDCAPVTVRSACTGKTTVGGPTARLVAGTATADSTCTSCVAGTTFGPADGSTDCAPVTVRSACTGKTTAGGPTARLVAGTATADSTCTSCVAGTTFGPADGSTDCAPVTVRSACTGKTTAGGPTARLVAGTATADSTCTSCVAGTTFGPADGSTDCAPVTVRSACTGKTTAGGPTARLVAGTATADSTCTSCVAGTTFGPADGSTDCAPVTVCGKKADGSDRGVATAAAATTDTVCNDCEAGSIGVNTGDCTACAAGEYQGSAGQSSCNTCAGGTSGTTGSTGATSCNACEAGYGVKSGSGVSAGTAGYCEACTHDNANDYDFNANTDSSACGNSQTCAIGKGFTAGSASSEGSCADCTAAAVASCDVGALNSANNGCVQTNAIFAAAVDATYSGANSHGACHTVAAGSAFVWKNKNSVECAAGYTGTPTYDANDGSYSSGCAPCAAGKSKSAAGSAACTACADGTYQDGTGKTSCKNVDNGKFGSVDGTTYADSGAKSQHDCAAGSFSDYSSSLVGGCDDCANGKFQGSAGQDSCDDIPDGKFGSTTTSRGTTGATKAAYSGGAGATKAYECYPGTVNVNGDGDCVDCVAGKYQSLSGQTSCTNVPAGSEGSKTDLDNAETRCHSSCTGATGIRACTISTGGWPGFSAGGSGMCAACSLGSEPNSNHDACQTCTVGSSGANGLECLPCDKNKYSTSIGATSCTSVVAGQEPQVGGAVTGSGADSAVYCANTDYQTTDTVYGLSGVQICKPVPAGQKGSTVNNPGFAANPGFSARADCGVKSYRLINTDATSCTALLDGEGCTERTSYDSTTFTSTTHTDALAQDTKCSAKADCGVNQYRATTDSDATCYILGAGKECITTRSGTAVDKDTADCKQQAGCQTAGYYSNAVTFAVSSKANLCQECSDDFGVGAWNDDDQAGCGECIPGYGVGGGVAGVTCEQCVFEEYNAVTSNSACVNMSCALGKGTVSNPNALENANNCTDCVDPFFSDSDETGVCEELHCAPGFWLNYTNPSIRPNCVRCDTGYALVSAGNHQDRSCTAHTTCPATQGQNVVPNHYTDRTCKNCTVDAHPFGTNIAASYSNVNDGSNCVDIQPCNASQYYVPGDATTDRQCISCNGEYAVKDKASHHDLHCEVLAVEAKISGVGVLSSTQSSVQLAVNNLLSAAGVGVREAKTSTDPYGRRVEVTDDGTDIIVKVWVDDVLANGITPDIEDENKAVVGNLVVSGATVSFANSACYTWAPKDGSISQNDPGGCHPVLGNGEHCQQVCASGYEVISNSTCAAGVYTAGACLSPDEKKLSFAAAVMDKVKLAPTPKDKIAVMKAKSGGVTHAEERKTIQYLFTEEANDFVLDLDDSFIGTAFKAKLQAEGKTEVTYVKPVAKTNAQYTDCSEADVDTTNSPDAWVLSVSETEVGLICEGKTTSGKPVAKLEWAREIAGGNDVYNIQCFDRANNAYGASFEKAAGTTFDCKSVFSNSPVFWVSSLSGSTCKPVATAQGSIMREIGDCPTTLQVGQTCQPTCPGLYYMETVGQCDAAGNYIEPECRYSCDSTFALWRTNGCCSSSKDDVCKTLKTRYKNHNCCD